MKTKIFALLATLLIVAMLVPMAFAAAVRPADSVDVPATMQVRKEGTDADWSTSGKSVVMSTADMEGEVDFRCELNTVPIKNAITRWYQYGVALIADIAGEDTALAATLTDYFNVFPVTGTFTVTIDLSDAPKIHVPEAYTNGLTPMIGFNAEAGNLFEEIDRELSADGKTLTINLAIKDADADGEAGIMEQALYNGVVAETYLNELTFTVEGVTMDTFTSTQTIRGALDGTTTFQIGKTASPSDSVRFKTQSGLNATLRVKGAGGGVVDTADDYKITFNIDGDTKAVDPMYGKGTIKLDKLPKPTKVGYTFDGWYFDSEKKEKVDKDFTLDKNITLYGHWVSSVVDTENHFAYVIGYPDNTVRPNQNITREEVAMIFYRLLRDDVRAELRTDKNDFTDVADDRWSNVAISTMAKGGFILGYPDGTFAPQKNITRAEFATMATRFASLMDDSGASFTDIEGHWSKFYVLAAATAGWISGYPEGTFLPEKNITRAEAFTIINNVLSRSVNKEGLHADTTLWIDMDGSEWYYYITLEATNSHTFTRQEDGINEKWTAIIENKTWD